MSSTTSILKDSYFIGERRKDGCDVNILYECGNQISLPLGLEHRKHSPSGFEWGYGGSGPCQLALAMLTYIFPYDFIKDLVQDFKWDIINNIKKDKWTISTTRVFLWVDRKKEEQRKGIKIANCNHSNSYWREAPEKYKNQGALEQHCCPDCMCIIGYKLEGKN